MLIVLNLFVDEGMYLGTNLISQKLSFKISIISTIVIVFIITPFLFYFGSINLNLLPLLGSFVFLSIFIINFIVVKMYLMPINKVINVLKELQSSSSIINANLKDVNWIILEQELNNVSQKLNSDIYKIEELGQSRTQFLANVSHELKTPIFTIKGYIETLLDGGIDDTNVNRAFLEKIRSQTFRLETIFTDLIDITRIESGELKMKFDWFQFNDIIYWIKESFEHIAVERCLKLSLPKSIDYEIFADKYRIQTVLSNLFTNAINYSDSGTIRLSAKIEHDKLAIKVIDNGIGISVENQNRVFERFYREDTNRSRKTGGSGLGLAIVKHILDAHHSNIILKSQKNIGTTFNFSLPYRHYSK